MEGLGVQRIRKGEGRESVCVCVKERERKYFSPKREREGERKGDRWRL